MSSSESEMGSGERVKGCGCDGQSHGQSHGQSNGSPESKKNEKCSCHGNESFEKWKEEILSKGCKGNGAEKRKNGKKKEENGCEMFRAMSKKVQQEPDKCGCSCCSIVLCAAVLIAAGVTVAFIKKKYLD